MAMPEKNLHLQGKNSTYWQAECISQFTCGHQKIYAFLWLLLFFFLWLLFIEIALSGIFLTEFK